MKRDLFTDTPRDGQPAAEAQTCSTCAAASTWVTGNGHDTGFVNCEHMPSWHHLNPATTCTFSPARWKAIDAKKLVKRAAQAGIDQAVGAADRAAPGWSDRALVWIRQYTAKMGGRRLTGYELVQQSIGEQVEQPENPKAWGGPIQRAARAGYLVKVGTVADPNPERHGSDVPLWECTCAADTP